jgi:hypothetical protein
MSAISLEHGWLIWSCDHDGCTQAVEFRRMIGRPDPYGWSQESGQRGELAAIHLCPSHASDALEAAA